MKSLPNGIQDSIFSENSRGNFHAKPELKTTMINNKPKL